MREPEARIEPAVRFVAEQDGPAERQLKQALRPHLESAHPPRRAYLARVRYADSPEQHVALCLTGPDSAELVQQLAGEFAALFGSSVHLDMLFLTAAQEVEVRKVCRSFPGTG